MLGPGAARVAGAGVVLVMLAALWVSQHTTDPAVPLLHRGGDGGASAKDEAPPLSPLGQVRGQVGRAQGAQPAKSFFDRSCCGEPPPPATLDSVSQPMSLEATIATTAAAATTTTTTAPPVVCAPPDTHPIACRNLTGGIALHPRVVAIVVDASQGLGCQLLFLIRFFFLTQKFDLTPYAELVSDKAYRSTSPDHTHNFLRYAFDPCGLTESERVVAADRVACGRASRQRADRPLGLARALHAHTVAANLTFHRKPLIYLPASFAVGANLFRKFLRITPTVAANAEDFWAKSALGTSEGCTVAVHYRGLDKMTDGKYQEAERVPYERVLKLCARLVTAKNCTTVFVASDETPFIDLAKRWWGKNSGVSLVVAPQATRAACDPKAGCTTLHLHEQSDNYRKTREAVVTMILLSKCKYMIKTPSLFSAFAAMLNPRIQASLTHRGLKYAREYPERIMPLTGDYLKSIGA